MKVLFVIVEDKYFLTQRLDLAMSVKAAGHEVIVASRRTELAQKIKDLGLTYINIFAIGDKKSSKLSSPFRSLLFIK